MDVLVPLIAFLLGLGVHRWGSRLRAARQKNIEVRARLDVVLLDADRVAARLQRRDVRREIEELIKDPRR